LVRDGFPRREGREGGNLGFHTNGKSDLLRLTVELPSFQKEEMKRTRPLVSVHPIMQDKRKWIFAKTSAVPLPQKWKKPMGL
jgi:hypothetical protein